MIYDHLAQAINHSVLFVSFAPFRAFRGSWFNTLWRTPPAAGFPRRRAGIFPAHAISLSKGRQRRVTESSSLMRCSHSAAAAPVREGEAAVDFRALGVLRGEEGDEFRPVVDLPGMLFAIGFRAGEKRGLDVVEDGRHAADTSSSRSRLKRSLRALSRRPTKAAWLAMSRGPISTASGMPFFTHSQLFSPAFISRRSTSTPTGLPW